MLKLQNINRTNSYIEAHYIPENSSEVGYLKLNCQTKQIVDSKITSYGEWYQSHAITALKQLLKKDDLPNEKLVAWY